MATFTVTNLNDSGAGSLRAAIEGANATSPGSPNTINFSAGLSGGTITLTSDLPTIINPTAILATSTDPGNPPTIGIDFNGHSGLVFDGGAHGSQVVGLALGGATGNGITLNVGDVTINNNYIGLALDGSARGNSIDGIFVSEGSSGNLIGSNPNELSDVVTNVISSNGRNGITFHGSADNVVVSNRIGTSVDGMSAMANGGNGMLLTAGSNNNTLGGTASYDSNTGEQNDPTGNKGTVPPVFVVPALGNLVSGNTLSGIRIDNGSTYNVLEGNFVGTTPDGDAPLGNGGDGVLIVNADNNSLLGCTFVDNPFIYYNVLSGNGGNGIHVTDSDNVVIQANFVGVGADNATVVANGANGLLIDGSSQGTQVGGVIPLGNVISGNTLNGIYVTDTASGFETFNTFAGVLAFSGIAPNGANGVLIDSTGGNQTVRTNVLSGNVGNGLEISGDASGVTVVPNIIGLNTRGDVIIANGGHGVLISGTAHDNVIGGDGADQVSVIRQNTFSGNTGYGVAITGAAYNNTVKSSAIGTDIQELIALPNGEGGVLIDSTGPGNVIGVPLTGWSPLPSPAVLVNIISGNDGNGITLGPNASGNVILNNWIGLNVVGAPSLPNTGETIQTNGNRNLIYGNTSYGSLPLESPTGQLQALYIGWFGWAADPESFNLRMETYLTDILNGATLEEGALSLSEEFATAPELAPYAPLASMTTPVTNPTPEQIALATSFINQTFTNLFNRTATVVEQQVWRSQLFSGAVPFSAMVYDIANASNGSDSTAINSKIEAASYFTSAHERGPAGIAAVQDVVDTTTMLASMAATDANAGMSHAGVTYQSILEPYSVTTGVRAGLDGTVILTGIEAANSGSANQAYLYEGPLNNTSAGTKHILTPTFAGQTITTASFYGPDTSIFTPSIGLGNVRAVGSYEYAESPSGTLSHGMIYQGPVNGAGGTWTQIDVPTNGVNVTGGIVLGGQVEDTILHSTMGDLVVGNYDLVGQPGSANGFIFNMATQQYTLMSINGSLTNLTSLYGIWQNGIGSTSYTIAGGTYVPQSGINQAFLQHYDSSTGVFSDLTYYTGYNLPGIITHFENITAVPGGYNLVATTTEGPAFASIVLNQDGTFGNAHWVPIDLPGSDLLTGNIAYQNVIGGIYNTPDADQPATYLGVVDQGHVTPGGGRIMPMGSYNFAYALTVTGGVGETVTGSNYAGNVLGGSIGNETFVGTQQKTQSDTIFTGGGADIINLVSGHTAPVRIELYAGNGLNNAANLKPGGVVASVYGSIVDANDIPQLGWWGQATAQLGGPVSNASTNAGLGTGTSKDMSTVTNFVTGSTVAAAAFAGPPSSQPVDTIDISLGAFSNLLRNLGSGDAPGLGAAVFSNIVELGGTVTVSNANVLRIGSLNGFADASELADQLLANPITFAGTQTGGLNHYIVAYQDRNGNVRIADMDIHASGPFTTTGGGQTLSISDMVLLNDVTLASLLPGNITFLSGSGAAVVSDGQTLFVFPGQTLDGVTVLSGGELDVLSGGVASGVTTSAGGIVIVFSGGAVNSGSLAGFSEIGTGGAASGVTIHSGGRQNVSGTVTGTVVSNGGRNVVYAGGVTSGTTVSSGGVETNYGSAVSAVVASGGELDVYVGAVASGTTTSAGGVTIVYSGGAVQGGTLAGFSEIGTGATASGVRILAGGRQNVSGTATGTVVSSGGQNVVYAGGITSGTTVSSGGVEVTHGSAVSANVASGGELDVFAGAVASGTTTSAGGATIVYSGGTVQGGTLAGFSEVGSGATASAVTILSGGRQNVSGAVTGTAVSNGGQNVIYSGGVAVGTVVSSGGTQSLYAGGIAALTVISTGGQELNHGSSFSASVASGGALEVFSGGVARGTVTSSGGATIVYSGGTIDGATLIGFSEIGVGAVGSSVTIMGGGRQNVSGTVLGTVVSNGGQNVLYAGGVASNTVVSSGGVENNHGTTVNATVASGGELDVYAGAVASGTTTSNGGVVIVYTGGLARGGTLAGFSEIGAGGAASGITIVSGARQNVYGNTTGTVVSNGGLQVVYAGGLASGTLVMNGGTESIYEGATASGTTVSAGGMVADNGTVIGATIHSGGELEVRGNGVVSGATLDGGLIDVVSGAGTGGLSTISFASGGGTLELDAAQAFNLTIAGFGGLGDRIDFGNIAFGVGTTLGFVEDSSNTFGTLTVSDTVHTASFILLGQYAAGDFTLASNGNGGSLLTAPSIADSSPPLLTNQHV
jgi:autotransporter passenger strand-loop-strand repeat protein